MSPLLIIGVVIAGLGVFFASKSEAADGGFMSIAKNRLFDLPDVEPANQGGKFSREFDTIFETVANETDVPFALLKSHAIRESSLKANAYRDENPTKRTDRIGWASRGLMQVLFWPGSKRFEQFGYSAKDLRDGEALFEPYVNVKVAGLLIRSNLEACGGNLRDAVNMYNTGKTEAKSPAPGGYVNKVLEYYDVLTKGNV